MTKPTDWQIGNLPDDLIEQMKSEHPDLRVSFHFRRFSDMFMVLVFDREYSVKEPVFGMSIPLEQMAKVTMMSEGSEFWKEGQTNEKRLEWLIEHGHIDS